jgi:YidC/Oxa1 family membrane protein insertase
MYDRKTWIVLIICGILLAIHFQQSATYQRELADFNERQRAAQRAAEAAEAEAADPLADPAQPVQGLAVTPAPQPLDEEFVTLENDHVVFTFTNIGGGIKHAEFKDQFEVGSDTRNVRMNRFGPGPIGGIASHDGSVLENISYAFNEETSEPGKRVVMTGRLPSGLIVRKTYSLLEGDAPGTPFLLDFDLKIENTAPVVLNLNQWSLFLGEASPLYQREQINHTGFFWREDGDLTFREAVSFKGGWFSSATSLFLSPAERIEFAGVSNQFFATALRPTEPATTTMWARPDQVVLADGAAAMQAARAGLVLPSVSIEPGAQHDLSYRLFIGPKHNRMLRQMGEGWGDIMQYGWFWWVSRPLNWLLNSLHNLLDGFVRTWSWGLAIIFLTIVVRIFIWPLHAKSTRTMKRMSKLQPEMAKLKEKYPDDPNKLNQEMMGLYRKFGINPLGGCLPMLLQIPIFFGFFKMLQSAVELRGQGFLWVQDLSQPDTLGYFMGIPINILPIVMGITSFLQIAIMPKTGDKLQQRIILFMPLIFFIFCYNFAAALALYWTTQNLFSIGQTYLMNKMPEPALKARKDGGKKSWVERMAEKQAELQKLQKQRGAGGGPQRPTPGMRDVTPDKKKRPPKTGG